MGGHYSAASGVPLRVYVCHKCKGFRLTKLFGKVRDRGNAL